MINDKGFYRLTPTDDINRLLHNMFTREPEKSSNQPKEKTKSKKQDPKFKKGSWKHILWKKLKKWKSSRFVEEFHFVKQTNYLVYQTNGDQYRVEPFSTKIKRSKLDKLKKRDAWVMISSYDREFMKTSLRSYLRLMQIDRIALEYHLIGILDDEEPCDIYDETQVIDNVNDLVNFIKQHRAGINGVYDIQSYCCGYTYYEFKFRMVVRMRDGSVKTYKSENDFMKEYDLLQF